MGISAEHHQLTFSMKELESSGGYGIRLSQVYRDA